MKPITVMPELVTRISAADEKYSDYTSTHEAMGVITEEYAELIEAVRANDLTAVRSEALDIAAAAIRLAMACGEELPKFWARSGA